MGNHPPVMDRNDMVASMESAAWESAQQLVSVDAGYNDSKSLSSTPRCSPHQNPCWDTQELIKRVQPVKQELDRLDAEAFLQLRRADGNGARLREGVCVHPIHKDIRPTRKCAIRYLPVADQSEYYNIGVFIFPPHARMPLHDHPGMCVVTRVLYGNVKRVQLDLISSLRSRQVAIQHDPDHLQAPDCVHLFPGHGNLHEFVAGPHGAALLDVLIPPYNDDRDCTYYQVEEELKEEEEKDGSVRCYVSVLPDQSDKFPCLSGTYHRWET